MDRYYSDSPITTDSATLDGPEAHHLIHVMRCRPGMRVVLFDGSGGEFEATVVRVGRSEVELSVGSRREVDRELPFELTLAVALPKGDRQKWLVEKLVELGVTRLVPLSTARSVAQPVAGALERLRRGVIEASKQCGRNRLMEIAAPAAWDDFLVATAAVPVRLLAHPDEMETSGQPVWPGQRSSTATGGEGGEQCKQPSPPTPLPVAGEASDVSGCGQVVGASPATGRGEPKLGKPERQAVVAAVGPEGGFTDDEVAAARQTGWQPVDLGPRILRVETAAICLAARLLCWAG